MPDLAYTRGLHLLGQGALNLATADLRCLLVTSSYSPDVDHDFVSDVVAAELSGGNYVRKTLASKTWTAVDAADEVQADAADLLWSGLQAVAGTPTHAIVFLQVTNDADSPLVAALTLSPVTAPNGGDYTVALDALGYLALGQP